MDATGRQSGGEKDRWETVTVTAAAAAAVFVAHI